jgi:hypothetical protein
VHQLVPISVAMSGLIGTWFIAHQGRRARTAVGSPEPVNPRIDAA